VLFTIGLAILCSVCSYSAGVSSVEPPVVTEVVRNQCVPEIRYVTQYVTQYIPVPEPYEVEVIKEVPVELSQFESEAELASYLKWYKQNVIIVPLVENFNCVDYALAFVERARKDGCDVHFQAISYDPETKRVNKKHALNSTIIGDSVYLIEPETYDYWCAWKI